MMPLSGVALLVGKQLPSLGKTYSGASLIIWFIDLPPGTADAPHTVMQSFPISGVIIVYTPQDLVGMIVRKAVNMAQKMDKRVLGVVENMSYFYVPEIDKRIEVFGKSRGDEMAKATHAPLLGQFPIDPELAKLCDEGNIERYDAEIINSLGKSLSEAINQGELIQGATG